MRAMKRRVLILSAFALAAVACNNDPKGAPTAVTTSKPTAEATGPLKAGDAAPDITVKVQDGKDIKLSSLAGKMVLVYFYPKDDTPGCTIEAQGLRDGWADIQAAGLEVYGVSTQAAESHKAFIEGQKLPFPLVVDTDASIAKAFRVPMRGSF